MVVSDNLDGHAEARARVAVCPRHLHPAFRFAAQDVHTVRLVNRHAAPAGDEAHNVVPRHGRTALAEAHGDIHILVAGQDDAVVRLAGGLALRLILFCQREQFFRLRGSLRRLRPLLIHQARHNVHRRHAAIADRAVNVVQRRKTILFENRIIIFRLNHIRRIQPAAAAFAFHHRAARLNIFLAVLLFQERAGFRLRLRGFADTHPVRARAFRRCAGDDFHTVARFQRRVQRHDAPIDFAADALIAHGGMNAVGEIQRRRALGHTDDVALGGEEEHFLGEEVGFQGIQEFAGVARVALPVQNLPHPVELGIQVVRRAAALFVAPVRRNAIFRDAVHLPGTNLHLERKRHLAPADDRCVQGLIHVRLRDGNVVLEAPRHLVPQRVDNAQHGIAIRHGVHQHANRN